MNITINWTDETKQVVHVVYGEGWTWDEFFQIDDAAKVMLNSLDHKADFILDLQSVILPNNVVGQFPRFVRGAAALTHPNSRSVALVGMDQKISTLLGVFEKVYPLLAQRIFIASSVEDAHTQLTTRRDEATG